MRSILGTLTLLPFTRSMSDCCCLGAVVEAGNVQKRRQHLGVFRVSSAGLVFAKAKHADTMRQRIEAAFGDVLR
jgi:hypothetical protein